MEITINMDNKAKFLKIYANLPISLRGEIILVLDEEPYTWNAAYLEVSEDSKLSKKILSKLEILEII